MFAPFDLVLGRNVKGVGLLQLIKKSWLKDEIVDRPKLKSQNVIDFVLNLRD